MVVVGKLKAQTINVRLQFSKRKRTLLIEQFRLQKIKSQKWLSIINMA